MSTDKRLVATYTVVHGTAEFLCAFTMFAWVRTWASGSAMIVTYSAVAFGFPLVVAVLGLGVLSKIPEGRIGLAGTVLMAAGILTCHWGWVCVVLLGLGSALFHIAAGTSTLKQPRPGTSVGVFESLGAVGLALGTVLGTAQNVVPMPWVYLGSAVILVGGFAVLAWGTPIPAAVLAPGSTQRGANRALFGSITPITAPPDSSGARIGVPNRFSARFAPRKLQGSAPRNWTLSGTGWIPIAVLIGLAVISMVRALAGFTAPQPWKSGNGVILAAAVFVLLGRAVGGIIADKLGFVVPAVAGFIGAAILLTAWPDSAAAGLLGVFFLALPMAPVILALLKSTGRPAVSFGLAQFLQVPAAFATGILWAPWVVFATLMICAVIVLIVYPLDGRKNAIA